MSWVPAAPVLAAVQDRTAVRLVVLTTTDPGVEIDVRTDLAHLACTGGTTGRSKAP